MLIPAWFQRFQNIREMLATSRISTLMFAALMFATLGTSLDGRSSEPTTQATSSEISSGATDPSQQETASQNGSDGTENSGSSDSPGHASASDEALWRRIDRTIESYHRGPLAPVVGNSEFVRRVYLDLIGRIPTAEEVTAFFQQAEMPGSSTDQVREQLIDDLLARDEFPRNYAKVLEIMFTERRPDAKISLQEFRNFIRGWLAERRPLNELCMEILAADGTGERYRPAASFFLNREVEPNLLTRDVGRIFFGRNVQCAQCHDHPLIDDYHQSEYFGILSFVNRSFLFQDEKRGNFMFLGEKADGNLEFTSVFRPEDGKKVAEAVLPSAMAMDSEPSLVDDLDGYVVPPSKEKRAIPRHSRRQQLAVLATHPKNHSFNRNLANRLWAQMLGIGIVHPVDAHHGGNPPVSSALLRMLADELVACDYDLRAMVKQIAMSHAYQRSQSAPDLDAWAGPPQGIDGLSAEIQQMSDRVQQFSQQQHEFEVQAKLADKSVRNAQVSVHKIQNDIEGHKKELQRLSEELGQQQKQLTELKAKQTAQQGLLASLRTAAEEAEKAVKLIPADEELLASQAVLAKRVASVTEGMPLLDSALSEIQERVNDSERRVDDQRSRIIALGSRRAAMSEFVAEARGVQRNVQSDHQVMLDQITDWTRQAQRCQELLDYLKLREEVRASSVAETGSATPEVIKKLELAGEKLIASWRRSHALGQIRGLTPEQLSSATFYALELFRPVEHKVQAEWQTSLADKPATDDDRVALRKRIGDAVAARQGEIEDQIAPRFSSPGGTPQDGFFATTDQALLIQNDPTFQSWIQPTEGTLLHRLGLMKSEEEVVESLYLSVLSRPPDSEEREQVHEYLAKYPEERPAVLQELVWGLLASTEFRFVP